MKTKERVLKRGALGNPLFAEVPIFRLSLALVFFVGISQCYEVTSPFLENRLYVVIEGRRTDPISCTHKNICLYCLRQFVENFVIPMMSRSAIT